MVCVKAFGEGDFEAPLQRFPGRKAFINAILAQVRGNLKALIADAEMPSQAALQGGYPPTPMSCAIEAISAGLSKA